MRTVMLIVAVTVGGVAACAAPAPAPETAPPSTAASPVATDLSAATVAYLRAWAANDVPTMVGASAPDSAARAYAKYWGRVFAAGRQDTGSADLILGRDHAVLRYPDARYRLTDFDSGAGGLRSWVSRPGGPVAERIVAGPPVRTRVGGLVVTVHEQYVNTAGDLRATVSVRRPASAAAAAVAAPGYRAADGARYDASLGAQARTGVVPLELGGTAALAAIPDAAPGGELTVVAYGRGGRSIARAVIDLPG